MDIVSISEARANLTAVIDRAVADKVPLAIVRQRSEGVVLISASEWASIRAVVYR